jgi:SAM-dependent methyltransferase
MNPMAEADVDAAIAALPLPDGDATVLETGCGGAELLLRVLEAHPGARGVGVDPDPAALARARAAAAARLPPDRRPELVQARAQDAAVAAGTYDLAINVASSHAHGGFPAVIGELAGLARPDGGLVFFGEGYWTRPPSDAYLEALGGATADELPAGVDELTAAARAAGLEVLDLRAASTADWAAYEEGLAAEAERHDDEDARTYARRIRDRRALPDGGATMGFALLTLRRRSR